MPQLHARYLEPEALREHLREANDAALAKTQDTGALDDDAAAALLKVIRERGEHGGGCGDRGDELVEERLVVHLEQLRG